MSPEHADRRLAFGAVFLIVALLAGQWIAAANTPATGVAGTGRVLGKTGFAYLGGLRTFAAAVLWNRLDPQFHEYYGGRQLKELDFMIPTMHAVVVLDPQFTEAYRVSSYIVFGSVGHEQGIEIAEQGVANNPLSGIMRANLAQLLFLTDKSANREAILEHVRLGLRPDTVWANGDEEYEGLATLKGVAVGLGSTEGVSEYEARLAELRNEGAGAGDHDHDGDGKQDH